MPRIDPISGCPVMTMGEFLAEEAQRENKSPGDIMQEIFDTMDDDCRKEEERMRNPEHALEFLLPEAKMLLEAWQDDQKYVAEWKARIANDFKNEFRKLPPYSKKNWPNAAAYRKYYREYASKYVSDCGEKPPMPVKVIRVLEAGMSQSFNSSTTRMVALCLCDDYLVRIATLNASHWSGTRLDPPEDDSNLEWQEILGSMTVEL